MTDLAILPLEAGARARLRRKAFDALRALGADRDVAARAAAEVSDVIRHLEGATRAPRLTVAVDPSGPAVAFVFAWDGADGARPATDAQPAPHVPALRAGPGRHVLRFALRAEPPAAAALASATEALLARSREELFADLAASNEALRRTSAEARAAGEAKARFLATMSHEIRTPLNAILGMNRLALGTDLDAVQRGYLEKVDAASRHLLGVIDDVLDVSRLEAGRVELESGPLDVRRLLDEVLALVGQAARAKGLRLAVDVAREVPPALRGDALRLRQVLVNLAGNAVKFTERGGVTLAVRVADAGDVAAIALRFEVRDTGIGLAAHEAAHLFDSFTQADATISRRYGGSGLGLAISKGLVELMGGTIGVTSRPGAGATFWFTARLERAAPEAAAAASAGAPAVAPTFAPTLRVLVAEDNALNQEVAVALLGEVGLVPTLVADGREALERLRAERFDLVLMDVQMPVLDGLAATRAVRADPSLRGLPVIAMTANALPDDRTAALAAGMDDVIVKPVEAPDLWRALTPWLPTADEVAAAARRGRPEAAAGVPDRPDGPHAPPRSAPLPEGVAGLDVAHGLRFARGRADLYVDLLERFLDDQGDAPRQVRQRLERGDRSGAERAAHTLRGLAACLGAGPLADAAGAVERRLRDVAGDVSGDAAGNAALDAALDVLDDEHGALFRPLLGALAARTRASA